LGRGKDSPKRVIKGHTQPKQDQMRLLYLFALLCAAVTQGLVSIRIPNARAVTSSLPAYKASFGTPAKAAVALSLVLLLKARCSPVELRTTTVCPSGPGSEGAIALFMKNDPDWHCLPGQELALKLLTSPLTLPGDPDWDETVFQGPRGLPTSEPIKR
jgi:hypothetical protein